jgi:cysteinyl-tRNA synthetase
MSRQHLGEHIHIHGGGEDLVYPHHECEQAQSRNVRGGSQVSIWVHSALVAYQGHKMSKSRGNIVLARDVTQQYDARALRLAVLTHYHHRYGVEWRDEFLDDSTALLERLLEASRLERGPDLRQYAEQFLDRIDDDLDFPGAVQILQRCVDRRDGGDTPGFGAAVRDMANLLGIDLQRPLAEPSST